jgi:hypothetical protein
MTRRRTFAAITVVTAVLVTAGLGARRDDLDAAHDDPCTDLEEVSEMCAGRFDCGDVAEEFEEACHAACMMGMCPDQVAYMKQDSIWSAPCDDMSGAPFWDSIETSHTRCRYKFHWFVEKADLPAFDECWRAEAEQRCPELTDTDWWARFRVAKGY